MKTSSTPRHTSRRDVPTVSNTLATKTTGAASHERGLVLEYHLARVLIRREHNCGYRRRLALVEHLV